MSRLADWAKHSMEVSVKNGPYRDWRNAVDQPLHRIYCVTLEDAGFDEEHLLNIWQSGETPIDFVEWLGSKYGLDPRPSLVERAI